MASGMEAAGASQSVDITMAAVNEAAIAAADHDEEDDAPAPAPAPAPEPKSRKGKRAPEKPPAEAEEEAGPSTGGRPQRARKQPTK